MRKVRIGGAALNQTPFDWDNNLENIIAAIKEAKSQKIDVLCLPELCVTGYGCEDLFLSDWLWQEAFDQLLKIKDICTDIFVAAGLPITYDDKLYNCACLISEGEIKGFVPKQLLANDGVHYEPRWFTPWPPNRQETITINSLAFPFGDMLFEYKDIKIGLEICEDAWQEDRRPGHNHFRKGVDLIINPSASHFAFGKSKIREEIALRGSSNFNCTYLYANLLGNEAGRMIYDGEIFIASKGKMIAANERLSFKQVNLLYEDIDFDAPLANATSSLPVEEKFEIFTKAVALGLFDYWCKSKSNGFILSMSGGADSSSCAVLVYEMVRLGMHELGLREFLSRTGLQPYEEEIRKLPEKMAIKYIVNRMFTCAYQGTENSSSETLQAAKALAKEIGAKFYNWKVDDEVQSSRKKIEKAIERKLDWEQDDVTLQNIQARVRAPLIWMLANINNTLLITTSNRSEGDVGYATMDGDTSGSIAPIAGVDKHFILQWLTWAEKTLKFKSLKHVNSLSPSAELRPADKKQTDEADLMPYNVIVEIERLAILERRKPFEVYKELRDKGIAHPEILKVYVKRFFQLWSRNQWKRERLAPSLHLDDFNVDPRTWCRFPILSSGFKNELKALEDL